MPEVRSTTGSEKWDAEQRRNAAIWTCSKCGATRGSDAFYWSKANRRPECKECTKRIRREQRAADGDRINAARRANLAAIDVNVRRDRGLRGLHNISLSDALELLRLQGGGCAICKTPEPGTVRWWHIDHDHACCPGRGSCGKCVRGVLCHRCNLTLGQARDSIEVLRGAIAYLEGWRAGG